MSDKIVRGIILVLIGVGLIFTRLSGLNIFNYISFHVIAGCFLMYTGFKLLFFRS